MNDFGPIVLTGVSLQSDRGAVEAEQTATGGFAGRLLRSRTNKLKLSLPIQAMLGGGAGGSSRGGGGGDDGYPNKRDVSSNKHSDRTAKSSRTTSAGNAISRRLSYRHSTTASGAIDGLEGSSDLADEDDDETGTAEASPYRERRLGSDDVAVMLSDVGVCFSREEAPHHIAARADAAGVVSVKFGTGGELGLSVVPALPAVSGARGDLGVPMGAKIHSLAPKTEAGSALDVMKLLRPGDVLIDLNGEDMRLVPFHQVIRHLNTLHPTNASTRTLTTSENSLGLLGRKAFPGAPCTPGAEGKTAPPSTSTDGSLADPPTPPSPAGGGSASLCLSPCSDVGGRLPYFAPPQTEGSRRSRSCRRMGTSFLFPTVPEGSIGVEDAPPSFSSSTSFAATPMRQGRNLAAKLNPWGGGTPGRSKIGKLRSARLKRSLTFSGASSDVSGSVRESPFSGYPADSPLGARLKSGPVAVTPAPFTSLTFCTGGREVTAVLGDVLAEDTSNPSRAVSHEDEDGEEEEVESMDAELVPVPPAVVVRERAASSSSVAFPPPNGVGFVGDGEREAGGQLERVEVCTGETAESSATLATGSDEGGVEKDRSDRETSCTVTEPDTCVRENEEEEEESSQEYEEDEVVSLSSYLACSDRDWPWAGKDIIWAEYVSLNGRHRWIRSEGCRHALLLVRGGMFLLELPSEAAERRKTKDLVTRSPGGWYLRIDASTLRLLSVPMTPTELKLGGERAFDWNKDVALENQAARYGGDEFSARRGLVFHVKSGACAWLECGSAGSRDALVDVVKAWHSAETKGAPLKVERSSMEEASAKIKRGGQGRHISSLLVDRESYDTW